MSKRTFKTAILSGLVLPLILGVASASAGAIFFDPTPKFVSPNDVFSVDLNWDGSGTPEYLGDFDLDIFFDPAVVTYTGATFGAGLGDCFFFEALCFESPFAGGVNLAVVSFLDDRATPFPLPPLIEDVQDALGNAFTLATLEFTAAAGPGETALAFTGFQVFGDEFGLPIFPTLTPGQICVLDAQGCPVPTPGSLPLLALGLFGFVLQRRMLAR